jgi:hypothetical protein
MRERIELSCLLQAAITFWRLSEEMLPITNGFLAGMKNRINAPSANMPIETIETVIHRWGIFYLGHKNSERIQ